MTGGALTERQARGLFIFGALLGLGFLMIIAWVNFEARMFYPADLFTPGRKRIRLRSLRCPLVVARDETAKVQFTVTNPLNRPIRRIVRFSVAHRHVLLVDQERIILDLGPRETRRVVRDIAPDKGVYGGWMLLVSVYVARTPPLDPALNDCGTLVMPVRGIPGWVLVALWNGLAIGLMAVGWWKAGPQDRGFRTAVALQYSAGLLALLLFHGWVVAAIVSGLALFGLLLQGLQRLEGTSTTAI
ncbi:MAG: hypothetical protein GXO54_07460 [Chloroflexi bacterium]|nr:hypothetical protein [Chloroflexota bacterium]